MYNSKDNPLRELFLGLNKNVRVLNNNLVTPINFDNAATTPVFKSILKNIAENCECYGSIGRGVGQNSEFCTKKYNECRDYILDFFNAPKDKYTSIFVNNTTEGINRLSNILIKDKDDIVILSRMEHHSNDLPWRDKCNVKYVEVDTLGRLDLGSLQSLLEENKNKVKYVSLTAASNVTGYINDIYKIASLVHKYNAKLIIDGAQIVAHRKIDMNPPNKLEGIDFLVFSAHKMYAPFGSGAIVGLKEVFEELDPFITGGGTVDAVLDNFHIYSKVPEKNEAGSPNFFGAIALVTAMQELQKIGFKYIEESEKELMKTTLDGLKSIKGITNYADCNDISDRLGIIVFNVDNLYNEVVAKYLANLRGISVRQGGFCAHPYIKRLLNLSDEEAKAHLTNHNLKMPGMVRASFGIYNSIKEVEVFLNTIELITKLI